MPDVGRYTPEARQRNIRLVVEAIKRAGRPLIVSEVADYARMNHETATTVVRAALRLGILRELPAMKHTRTGWAKQYELRRRPPELAKTPNPSIAPIRADDSTGDVCAVLDRWMAWAAAGHPPIDDYRERALYVAIDAALRSMPATHCIALHHVHRLSIWTFRRVDLEAVYREALDKLARRLEPLMGREMA